MRLGPRCVAAIGLAALLAITLAACGNGSDQSRGTIRIPIYGGIHVPDPANATTVSDIFVDSLLYSGLVKFSPDLHVIPELAVSIPTISSSGLSYTFTIRRDARFADGRRCTAWDVAYSLARAVRIGGWSARHALGDIRGALAVERGHARTLSGVTVLRRLSLRIHLTTPNADFLQDLAFPAAAVVDRRVVPEHPMRAWLARPAGTGPWMFSSRTRDGWVTLLPRPHYYATLQVRSLLLSPVRDSAAGLALYRKGALDMALVPPNQITKTSSHADFRQSGGLSAYYALPVSGDARPLAADLDRDRLARDAGMGLTAMQGIVPPVVPDYVSSPPSIDAGSDPPVSARAVVIETERGADTTITDIRRALSGQWRNAAIATPRPARVRIVQESHLLPDPGIWLRIVMSQTRSRWLRSSLAAAGMRTNDPVDRMNTYDQIERWALAKGYVIPLAEGSVAYVVRPSVQGMQVTPLGMMPDNNTWVSASVT